jgi:ketosteroid isomerase-like protein
VPSGNLEVVRAVYAAVARGDLEQIFAYYAEDVEYDLSQSGSPVTERVTGHEAIRDLWRTWMRTWDEYQAEPEEFVEVGDAVFVRVHVKARSKAIGVPLDAHTADVFTLRDGKIVRLVSYADVDVARRAWLG